MVICRHCEVMWRLILLAKYKDNRCFFKKVMNPYQHGPY
jgi:hypothetical protein